MERRNGKIFNSIQTESEISRMFKCNTFSKSNDPFFSTPTLGVSKGSNIRLSLVHVMNWNGG
jgi:hypothetical protein